MKFGTAEYSLNQAKKEIDQALASLSKIRNEIGGIAEIKKIPSLNFGYNLSSYFKNNYISYNSTRLSHVEQAYANFQKFLAETRRDIESIHTFNLPSIENNIQTRKKICDFMSAIGISDSYTVYELPSSRHKVKQKINKRAGYCSDIERCIPISDSYDSYIRACNEAEARFKKEYDTLIAAIKKADQEAEKAQKEKENVLELARFQVKYETTGDWNDILNIILSKNKYLHLGHFLLKNRGDWSDGTDYAETGLRAFKVDNMVDQAIYNEILGLIDNWDGDGRVFRDCQSNYDYLFAIVKGQKLIEDYWKVKEKLDG